MKLYRMRSSMCTQMWFSILTLAVLTLPSSAQVRISKPLMIPVEFRQDFEEGHTSGWESYPPFQDSAFDPGFTCSRENALPGSRYSLSRKVQIGFPTKYEIGFIRRVHLCITRSSSVSLSYLLNMYGDETTVDVVICGMNGKRYTYTIRYPKDDRWQTVTVPVSSFRDGQHSLAPGEEMEAFYILSHIRKTNPDVAYRIYLDNVVITGTAPAQFHILTPKSSVLEHWNKTVLDKHYATGETLSLAVSPPLSVSLASTKFSLSDPQGVQILESVPLEFSPKGKVWENTTLYTFSRDDKKGIWTGKVRGQDNQGRSMETVFEIWLTEKSQPHPRMYFGSDNIDFYTNRVEDPKWKAWFDSLAAKSLRLRTTSNLGSIVFGAETSSLRTIPPTQWTLQSLAHVDLSVFDTTYLLPTLSHYYDIMIPARDILYDNALLYAMRGDRDAGEYAKDALLAIAQWKTWTHPWFLARRQESYYPVGELGLRAAFCYDVVYPLMTPDERTIVQKGLLQNCIIPVYQEYVVQDRIPSSTSNWIGNSVAGALSSILSIYGDAPEQGDYEPYLSGLLTKLKEHISSTLDTSGAWGEGLGYQSFAYTNVLPTITALDRVLHTDITPPALLHSYLYYLYDKADSEVLDVGDSHASLNTLSYFAWILSRTEDPVFRWLYDMAPRDHPLDFLFGREHGPVVSPDSLPKARLFTEIGGVTFRSGWSPDDLVMNFRCGPFYNHQHFHQGSFQLSAFGETLVPEAGVVNYYNDPWYQTYYIQAAGHNTVLVDDNPGSQRSGDYLHFVRATDDRAEMQEFIGTDYYAAASGELHKLYRGALRLFERNVVFIMPDYFVVFDRLRSDDTVHTYNWLLHFDDKKDVTISGMDIAIERDRASLLAKVLSPLDASIEMRGAPSRFGVPITQPGYIEVNSAGKEKDENFLVVLYPIKTDSTNSVQEKSAIKNVSGTIRSLRGKNYLGTQIGRGDAIDRILFRVHHAKEDIRDGHVATDGRILATSVHNENVALLAVHGATFVTFDGARWHSALSGMKGTTRFTAAGAFHGDTARWELQASNAGMITFHFTRKPSEIVVNGQRTASFSWNERNQLASIDVTKGANTITIQF
jgi:hypothetical protein